MSIYIVIIALSLSFVIAFALMKSAGIGERELEKKGLSHGKTYTRTNK